MIIFLGKPKTPIEYGICFVSKRLMMMMSLLMKSSSFAIIISTPNNNHLAIFLLKTLIFHLSDAIRWAHKERKSHSSTCIINVSIQPKVKAHETAREHECEEEQESEWKKPYIYIMKLRVYGEEKATPLIMSPKNHQCHNCEIKLMIRVWRGGESKGRLGLRGGRGGKESDLWPKHSSYLL